MDDLDLVDPVFCHLFIDQALPADRFEGFLRLEFSTMLPQLYCLSSRFEKPSHNEIIGWTSVWGTLYRFQESRFSS
jgi:hypothetical protein